MPDKPDEPVDTPAAPAAPDSPDPKPDAKSKGDDKQSNEPPVTSRAKFIRGAIGIGGFIAGIVFGTYGEELIQRTNPGFFGPDNQAVIEEQKENFAALEARLAELKLRSSDDPQTQAAIAEIETLLATQKEIAARKDVMFKETDIQAQTLKKQMLEATETTTGVDFWINRSESMVLVDPDKVFSIVGEFGGNGIVANLSGTQSQMLVGDKIRFETTDGPRVVIYRAAQRKSDDRFGFDLARPGVDDDVEPIKSK